MISEQERRIAEFVDRRSEMQRFRDLLETDEKPIMLVSGSGGMGKSSLLARMIHECAVRTIPMAEVVWTGDNCPDYLAIMRKCRDDLGVSYFSAFTDLVNYYTHPHYELKIGGNIQVGAGAVLRDATVEQMAGVIIRDSMIMVPRADMEVPESERRLRLTERFVESLNSVAGERVVIFLDAVEKMAEPTQRWFWESFVGTIRSGCLPRVRIVVSGKNPPTLDRMTRGFVEEAELPPLGFEHIVEYLKLRGVPEADRPAAARFLLAVCKGNPLDVANAVDAVLKQAERDSRVP